jgi:NADH:ubiquinone oxidoreductase subunit 2 (subunit N)
MQKSKQNAEGNIDGRYRTMLVLWVVMLMNIGLFFVFSLFLVPEAVNEPVAPVNSLFITVVALGAFTIIISFAVKRKFFERSVEKQEVDLVQKGLVIACAMCEVSALLGLVLRFLIDQREYYLLFLIAAIGTAFHFPRREQLLSATYKTSRGGATS